MERRREKSFIFRESGGEESIYVLSHVDWMLKREKRIENRTSFMDHYALSHLTS